MVTMAEINDATAARAAEREEVLTKARAAKAAAPVLATLPTPDKDALLRDAAEQLVSRADEVLAASPGSWVLGEVRTDDGALATELDYVQGAKGVDGGAVDIYGTYTA